ncbi:MAG: Hint domain-containing protein [Rhodobacteraceae bacterium]|nr:Hint domain-containing protein [Paracoccaceae bacterium]
MSDLNSPVHNIPVYRADDFRVTCGANQGDAIAPLEDLVADDVYSLIKNATRRRLALSATSKGHFLVADTSQLGTDGATLHLDCALELMTPDGQITDALVLVEIDDTGHIAGVYLLPLAPLLAKMEYSLVAMDRASAHKKFAHIACVSFTRGTHVTLGSGAQKRIEDISIGDKVLTRDDGVQMVRWIGQSTVRATGDLAPIVITAGTLNNTGDLVVSPDHRMFIYQRSDQMGAGQPEVLVKARHLVNGATVYVQQGGFVDYFQILFDAHHIIYAEGIAAESMLVDPRTRPVLPTDILKKLGDVLPGHRRGDSHGLDLQKSLLERPDAIELLRRASMR